MHLQTLWFFRLSKVFLVFAEESLEKPVKMLMFIFLLFYNTVQIPLYLILLLCHEADLDNWKVFKKYRVVDSSAWNSCSTLGMVWCKQGIIARSADWIFCWNRPDWTQNVITVKTGMKSWLQRTQSEMNGIFSTYIYIFIHRIFYSLENRGKNLRKIQIKICQFIVSPQF